MLYGAIFGLSVDLVFWPVSVSACSGRVPLPPCGECCLSPVLCACLSACPVNCSHGAAFVSQSWDRVCQTEMCVWEYVSEAMSEVRGRFRPIPALPLSGGLAACLGPSGALTAPPAVCGPKALGGDCILSKNGLFLPFEVTVSAAQRRDRNVHSSAAALPTTRGRQCGTKRHFAATVPMSAMTTTASNQCRKSLWHTHEPHPEFPLLCPSSIPRIHLDRLEKTHGLYTPTQSQAVLPSAMRRSACR